MGKLAALLTGLFVLGAGFAVEKMGAAAFDLFPALESAPIPYEQVLSLISMGLLVLGGAITAYAILAVIFGIIRANWRRHKRKKAMAAEEKRRKQAVREGRAPNEGDGERAPRRPRGQPRERLRDQGYGSRDERG